MKRSDVINRLAQAIDAKTYIEIGVEGGVTFNEVNIENKHGVDPDLKVGATHLNGSFSPTTSDSFFLSEEVRGKKFDIIFIDGLHTYEQSLRDLLNAINFVSDYGAIVLDDVVPSDAVAAMRSHARARNIKERIGAADRNWMGDVFKTVAFTNDFLPGHSYATTADDARLCVVWKDPQAPARPAFFDDLYRISTMEYVDLLEMDHFYNYRSIEDIAKDIERRNASK